MTKIAVTGYKGRLGSELINRGCLPLDCDILSRPSIQKALHDVKPDIVIHCAASTDVDKCEEFQYESFEVNVRGTENLKICFDGKIIFLSTDYIFDGEKGMYSEDDTPSVYPKICWYGYTKLLGEELLGKNDTIIRTTMLYGSPVKDDFVTKIIQKLELNEPFEVTKALHGTPTYVPHLAEAIVGLLERDINYMPFIINIAGRSLLSRYEFALMIANMMGYKDRTYLIKPTMKVGKVKRPKHAGLSTDLAKIYKGLPIYFAVDGLREYNKTNRDRIFKQLKMPL